MTHDAARSARFPHVRPLVFLAVAGALAFAAGTTLAQKSPVPEAKLPAPSGVADVRPGVTVFVDISGKRAEAAGRMTATHEEMAKRGYAFVHAMPHVENGDLQGFFVTYVPPR